METQLIDPVELPAIPMNRELARLAIVRAVCALSWRGRDRLRQWVSPRDRQPRPVLLGPQALHSWIADRIPSIEAVVCWGKAEREAMPADVPMAIGEEPDEHAQLSDVMRMMDVASPRIWEAIAYLDPVSGQATVREAVREALTIGRISKPVQPANWTEDLREEFGLWASDRPATCQQGHERIPENYAPYRVNGQRLSFRCRICAKIATIRRTARECRS